MKSKLEYVKFLNVVYAVLKHKIKFKTTFYQLMVTCHKLFFTEILKRLNAVNMYR